MNWKTVIERLKSYPCWIRDLIKEKDKKIREMEKQIENMKFVGDFCSDYEWYSVGIHTRERRALFIANRDDVRKIGVFGAGAVILIGYKKEEDERKTN